MGCRVDALEKVSKLVDVPIEQIFLEICDSYDINQKRRMMFWIAYRTECYLPPFVVISCLSIVSAVYENRLARHVGDTKMFDWQDAKALMERRRKAS